MEALQCPLLTQSGHQPFDFAVLHSNSIRCGKCHGKIARFAARPPFGLSEVPVAVGTPRLPCRGGPESANIHVSSGAIWGIPA
jgi:hypothetical protein